MSGVASPTARSVVRPVASSVVGSDGAGGGVPSTLSAAIVNKSVAVFGTKQLVSGYAGPAVNLRRISDNTLQDFSFTNGVLDQAAIESFAGASQLRIQKWYDQTGNGNDLISSATATQRPGFRFDGNNIPVITFSDFANLPVIAGPEYLECSTGDATTHDISVVQCGRWLDQSDTQPHNGPTTYQIGLASTTGFIDYQGKVNVNTVAPVAARYVRRTTWIGGTQKTVNNTDGSAAFANICLSSHHMRSKADGYKWKMGGWFTRTGTAGTSASLTGIRLGASFGTAFKSASHNSAFIVSQALTDEEEASVNSVFNELFSAVINTTKQVVIEGDSISAGYDSTLYDDREFSWPFSVQNNLVSNVLIRNVAISDGHINGQADGGTAATEFGPQAPDKIDELFDATTFSAGQLLVVWAGTNDLFYLSGADGDAEIVHTRLQTYCAARKTAGWDVLVIGPIPRQPFDGGQKETELVAYDALIAANWATYADGYVNMLDEGWVYATHYLADGIHPNAAGHAKAAALILPAIQALI